MQFNKIVPVLQYLYLLIPDIFIILGIGFIFYGLYIYCPWIAYVGMGVILLCIGLVPYLQKPPAKPQSTRRS